MIKFRDLLDCIDGYEKIRVVGRENRGLHNVYEGKAAPLKKIIAISDIIEKCDWGALDKKYCFLTRNVDSIGREPDAIIMFMNIERKDIETFKMITDNDLGEI